MKALEQKDVEIVRSGTQIVIPENITLKDAAEWVIRRMEDEETSVNLYEVFSVPPLEGAYALMRALNEKYGFVANVKTSFFSQPPTTINVQIDVDKYELVPWGEFAVAGIEGHFETDVALKDGLMSFALSGKYKKKHSFEIRDLLSLLKAKLKEHSIYKGKAIKVRFPQSKQEAMDFLRAPKYIDVSKIDTDELIHSVATDLSVRTNIFAPIEHTAECRKHGIPLRRGILLEGPFGTGKTMTAYVTAAKAVANKWTFIYLEDPSQLPTAVQFAKQYSPAVVFAEDIDRAFPEERDEITDRILNAVDGVDSKDQEIVLVFTTNDVNSIEPAMLRPGRLDAIVPVTAPDEEAAMRLVRQYGRKLIPHDQDLTAVGIALRGQIPAVIREVVERSKLAAIARKGVVDTLDPQDLEVAARTMIHHIHLMQPKPVDERTPKEKAADRLGEKIVHAAELFLTPERLNGLQRTPKAVPAAPKSASALPG